MSTIYAPDETKLLNPHGLVEHRVGQVTALSEDEKDTTAFTVGGYGQWTEKVNPRSLWRQKEKKQWSDFHRLRRKWLQERIPILHEELEQKLMKRFKTTNPAKMELQLNLQMMSDPRLNVMTRKGVRKTSVDGQKNYSAEIAARFVPKKSRAKR